MRATTFISNLIENKIDYDDLYIIFKEIRRQREIEYIKTVYDGLDDKQVKKIAKDVLIFEDDILFKYQDEIIRKAFEYNKLNIEDYEI